MSALRLGGAAVLAAVAVLAALLAADVRSWRSALAGGDAAYAVAPASASWMPSTRLGGAAETVLGTRDDVALRRALQLYVAAFAVPERLDTAVEVQSRRAQAASALARAATASDPAQASQAATLLGILAFRESAAGGGSTSAETAIADFSDAVRRDPANTAAKFDLELVLRLSAAHGSRRGAGPSHQLGRGGRRGAGGGVPGSGY